MLFKRILSLVLCVALSLSFGAITVLASSGPSKAAMPSSYPAAGTYDVDYMDVRLGTATPGAKIWYTMDGSDPKTSATRVYFDPINAGSIATAARFGAGRNSENYNVVIKAYAEADGLADSDVNTFVYNFVYSIRRGQYVTEILREGTADVPGLIKITDDYRVNMFLIVGSESALLIDGANETQAGILPGLIDNLTGGLPYVMALTHPDGDHVGAIPTINAAGIDIYVPRDGLSRYPSGPTYKPMDEGHEFDLGNTTVIQYQMYGHSTASVVFLCEKTGDLFTGDSFGNTNPWGMNSGLLSNFPLEDYHTNLVRLRDVLDGRAIRCWKAHDPLPTMFQPFMNNMIAVTMDAAIRGEAAVIPNVRSGSNGGGPGTPMFGYGNYRVDHDAVALHANYAVAGERVRTYQALLAAGFFPEAAPLTPYIYIDGPSELPQNATTATYTFSALNMPEDVSAISLTFRVSADFFTERSAGAIGWGVLADSGWSTSGAFLERTVTLTTAGGTTGDFDFYSAAFNINSGVSGNARVEIVDVSAAFPGGMVSLTVSGNFITSIGSFSKYDVNRDGVVDLADVAAGAFFFMANSNDAAWSTLLDFGALKVSAERCDVNGDGRVDIEDLILILNNYS
ncbi:MAG: chitobiase/beta-hexosaminidase C-terminal domain-containing protein [Oscillospiraceae bacterium]|nr:chitobiase/beta-hexosaminidase C-terminal domain-containing protein [Oscillospiraceae bacterium]